MDADAALAAAEPYLTPVAVADRALVEANLARMAALAADAGLRLRPHAKTHKSAFVARLQIAAGAVGLTAATLAEAEAFAAAGVEDILLAHPPAGSAKLGRLAALAGRVPRLAVAIDDPELAAALPAPVEVMWEVDTGLHRIGTPPGRETAARVLAMLDRLPAERFRGLMTHAGQAYQGDRAGAARAEWGGLAESAVELRKGGVEARVLSVGSTPTAAFAAEAAAGGITEMRPGTYVYGDANQVRLGSQRLEDCALAVVATVVSTPSSGRRVIDAGSKALSADLRVPGLSSFGIVLGHSELSVERLSEEHAVVTGPADLRLGDRVVVIPAHACTAVNLHPAVLFYGGGETFWDPVVARGWQG